MNYPSIEEVETATTEQLAEWYRFLKSPGMSAAEQDPPPPRIVFNQVLERESIILKRITERLFTDGGITPAISRKIGWEKR